jgi:cytochrome c-type biogenesis protein CcmE
MNRGMVRFLIGAGLILAAIAYLIWGGVQEAVVYFVTPAELKAQARDLTRKRLRLGGMVAVGSLKKDPATLTMEFALTDGTASIPVRFKGIPPDLFTEGRGAVVEGTYSPEGIFHSDLIMAKHSEEYQPPAEGTRPPSTEELFKSLIKREGR